MMMNSAFAAASTPAMSNHGEGGLIGRGQVGRPLRSSRNAVRAKKCADL